MQLPPFSTLFRAAALTLPIIMTLGCSSDDEEAAGQIKFYNAQVDSPDLFLTLDEDLETDEDDEFENTFAGVGFGESSVSALIPTGSFFYEISFQDDESLLRDDLEILNEGVLEINEDNLTFIINTGSLENSQANIFDIPIVDTEDLIENDEFILQIINTHPTVQAVDVYFSDTDETFNEAQLIATANSLSFTDPVTLEEDSYIIYLTEPGSSNIIFQSDDVSYLFNAQYFLAIRQNVGAGVNLFQLDNMTLSGIQTFSDTDADAQIRFYNGVHAHPSLPDYSGQITLAVDDITNDTQILTEQLAQSALSQSTVTAADDFSLTIVDSENGDIYIENALFSVPENAARTVFFYVDEVFVDDDGDGNFDENEDGIIDEIDAVVRTAIVNDQTANNSVETTVTVLNLADNDAFSSVAISFVEADETLADSNNRRSVGVGVSANISLLNNTYDVFAVANIENQDIILDSFTLTLDEDSTAQFLLLEFDDTTASGFGLRLIDQ